MLFYARALASDRRKRATRIADVNAGTNGAKRDVEKLLRDLTRD